eukprot:CAMPEP_0198730844 /NCGR_PEP_ID=MMETSP1475-20131203/26653_1 /TAXON_ID= ORGANISM="Unidentified sp., Strain CCMP1999" /NCGR_SAMPLE_ID=MMETSP1475 /ASSEMBLY_ACC=CAM_ASM_001111 /LENGTH=249 /DNA_ID=CAMNT_0044493711 /DNA_START=332 /DNA_END=1082 /DNA_ORIENTATION=-
MGILDRGDGADAAKYDVIAVDLRGVGLSDKPSTGYDKKTMAEDIAALMDELGVESAHIVGHDIGGMTGFAFASMYPKRTHSFTIMDVPIPGTPAFDNIASNPLAWHFAFHAAEEVPEALTTGREVFYYGEFIRSLWGAPNALTPGQIQVTIDAYSSPKTATAGFNWYREFSQDAEDNEEFFEQGKLQMPVLALNAGRLSPQPYVLQMMKQLAVDVRGQAVDSGHWIPEEQPALVVKLLKALIEEVEKDK